jgi:hypothetical protein
MSNQILSEKERVVAGLLGLDIEAVAAMKRSPIVESACTAKMALQKRPCRFSPLLAGPSGNLLDLDSRTSRQ